jgi:hypothetical protein
MELVAGGAVGTGVGALAAPFAGGHVAGGGISGRLPARPGRSQRLADLAAAPVPGTI